MVSGRQSHFVEGFKTITIDDEVLLDNIRNAVNMSIEASNEPKTMTKKNNKKMATPEPTPTSGMASEPMPTTTLGLTSEEESSMSSGDMGSEMGSEMGSGMGSGDMGSGEMKSKSPFKNVNSRNNKRNGGKVISGKVIGEMEEEEPVNRFEEERKRKQKERQKELDNEDNQESENDKEDEIEDVEEGFSGSRILEASSMKNILLAVLIAFIGYVIAMASMKNVLPIAEISPDLKRFKNLIYVGLFFLIVYLCLEIF